MVLEVCPTSWMGIIDRNETWWPRKRRMTWARKALSTTIGTFRSSAATSGAASTCWSDDQILAGWLIHITAAPIASPMSRASQRLDLADRQDGREARLIGSVWGSCGSADRAVVGR